MSLGRSVRDVLTARGIAQSAVEGSRAEDTSMCVGSVGSRFSGSGSNRENLHDAGDS